MKRIPVLLALLLTANPAFALLYGDVLGTWRGSIVETAGNQSGRLLLATKITAYGRGGLSLVQRITNSHGDVFLDRIRLNGRGILTQVTSVNGATFYRGSGTWYSGKSSIRTQAHLTYYDGTPYEEKLKYTFRRNRLSFRKDNSSGFSQSGTLTRQR